MVSSIKGDAPRIVVRGGYFGRYVSSGHLIYLNQGTLFAAPFDLKRLEVIGPAVPALEDITPADQEDIWVYDLASDSRTQLTFDPAGDGTPPRRP